MKPSTSIDLMNNPSPELLKGIANQLRIHSINATTAAGSGHPTSCCSAAELVATLFFAHMRYDPKNPHYPNNDRFILSKGHAAPVLYAAWVEAGLIPEEDIFSLRKFGSNLEGHPTPRLSFVDVATGSLGQGLSVGLGMAMSARQDKLPFRTYVLLGDGECAEGSVWEAASLAGVYRADNLIALVDVNRLGQSEATAFGHDLDVYRKRFESFGWRAIELQDGHDPVSILAALDSIGTVERPLAIIAKTLKGAGVSFLEDKDGWHGKALSQEQAEQALKELEPNALHARPERIPAPESVESTESTIHERPTPIEYREGEKVATRQAYGNALKRLGAGNPRIVVLDGDVKNSTHSKEFAEAFPDRFFECFIAEQNMVGMAIGLSVHGKIPFASSFGAFLTRAHDQIRMAGHSRSNLKLAGSHVGVSIGEDGGSQMALEDVAMMRAVPGSVVLYPCDAVSTEKLVERMLVHDGIAYLRTTRPKTPVIYDPDEAFPIGGAKILQQAEGDVVTVVAGGITVFEALKAAEQLKEEGIGITVIDAYSVKPLATDLIREAAARTNHAIITVEDHYVEGGLGDAVAGATSPHGIRVYKLAIDEVPRSGKTEELLARYQIDARAIRTTVEAIRGEFEAALT